MYDSCHSLTSPGAATTVYYKSSGPVDTRMKVALRSASTGWAAWAQSPGGGMWGSRAIFVYRNATGGAALSTAVLYGQEVGSFQRGWGLQEVVPPQASLLPSGELLVQFEVAWPAGGGDQWEVLLGTGWYNAAAGGLAGVAKHGSTPTLHALFRSGAASL